LHASLGLTVYLVTHDLETVFAIYDRVAVIVKKQLRVGTPNELIRDGDPWVRDYLDSPRVRAAREAARQQHQAWERGT
jgi:phospholipid/cholesterol/gamma-HCH transport system ATP-binding protein